jgi:hypothetical protein
MNLYKLTNLQSNCKQFFVGTWGDEDDRARLMETHERVRSRG